jgi:hypothetical protein
MLQCERRDLSSGHICAKRQPDRRQETAETIALSRPLLMRRGPGRLGLVTGTGIVSR